MYNKPLNTRKDLKYLNIISDMLLLFVAFSIAGVFRKYSFWGDTFFWKDVKTFQPLAIVYAITMTACYALQGSYQSLHIRNYRREFLKIAVINILGLLLTAAVLFVFQLSQFSRLWLIYFYVISTIVIVAKRVFVHRLATAYELRHHTVPNAIVIGNGKLALRFYRTVISKESEAMHYIGNVAASQNDGIPHYLGTIDDLAKIISTYSIGVVVIAEDYQNVSDLERILAIATNHKIRVCVVPIYTDLISAKTAIQSVSGMCMIDLSLLDTCDVMGLNIALTNLPKAVEMISHQLNHWRGHYVCIASVADAVGGYENSSLQEIQNNAVMTLPTGDAFSDYSLKKVSPNTESVSGVSLMHAILSQSKENHWKHYFIGNNWSTIHALEELLHTEYHDIDVSGSYVLPSETLSVDEDQIVTASIINSDADFVWVNLPSPFQECWMAAHENRIPALMIGVGDTFEQLVGKPQSQNNITAKLAKAKKQLSSYIKYTWWNWN